MRICAVDSAPDRERDKGAFWKGNWNISSGHIAYHGGCTGSHDEKEEKAQYMQKKKEKELSDREAAVTRSELMAEAKNNLSDEGLPVELAEVLNYTDADACKKSMETVKKAFQTAVEKAVDEKLKGGKPPKKAPETNTQEALEKQVYNAMMGIF